jgi:prepilin-type N-terminal cleavage/methylation domain-containing protein
MRQFGNNPIAIESRGGDVVLLPTYDSALSARRGWTLLELLTTIIIFSILVSGLAIGGRAVYNSRLSAAAKQQIKIISNAIEQYASSWPAWKAGSITVADRGWPDFIPGRLFRECSSTFGPYNTTLDNFNNDFAIIRSPTWIDVTFATPPAPDHLVLNANVCLVYSLSASSGKGPFIKDPQGLNVHDLTGVSTAGSRITIPSFSTTCVPGAANAGKGRDVFVDAWGTPLRYFWVNRDSTAYRGYLPVLTADTANASWRKADGFVLESAGMDKKFGNVWKAAPSQSEIDDAGDNLIVSP